MDDANEAMTVLTRKQNDGVALLLERMKTHPEEFTQEHKWMGVIRSYKEYLNEEDCKKLEAGINELMQQKFTEIVLEGLVNPHDDEIKISSFSSAPMKREGSSITYNTVSGTTIGKLFYPTSLPTGDSP